MEIGKQYKPELPTPKMMVEHLSAHQCMQILDPDYPSPILPPIGRWKGPQSATELLEKRRGRVM